MGFFKKSQEQLNEIARRKAVEKIRKDKAMAAYYKSREKAAIEMKSKEGREYYNKPHGFAAFATLPSSALAVVELALAA